MNNIPDIVRELRDDYPAVDVTTVVFSRDFAGIGCCIIPQDRVLAIAGSFEALVKALEAIEFRGHQGKCPFCAGWNMSPNGETPGKHTKDCLIAKALNRPVGGRCTP